MRLDHLLSTAEGFRVIGDARVEIDGLSHDSRRTKSGDLFFSLARSHEQAHRNLNEALSRGARAVVVGSWDEKEAPPATLVECERPRALMAPVASRFFNSPSERLDLVGITGTSGKTTSTYLLASIFESAGEQPGIIGTIGTRIGTRELAGGLTTPEALDFEGALSEMAQQGVRRVAAEISSIGIVEGRVEALNFRACLFTNLGRDHLDYHKTIDEYFAAKARLFSDLLGHSKRSDKIAVAQSDDAYGRRILQLASGRKVTFGFDPSADVFPLRYETGMSGIRATLSVMQRKMEISSPLLGKIYLQNIMGAVAVAAALGIPDQAIAEGIRRCTGAPGRLESIGGKPGVTILVDYAHKPDALAAVLETLRELKPRRILCVFGCGGDRDRGKRPIMGEIAARLSDLPILTSDNPRTEDPLAIIAEVEAGISARGLKRIAAQQAHSGGGYLVEPDRRRAIAVALETARPGDTVLIAGKGHEDYQLVGARKLHFDDREVAREVLRQQDPHSCA